MADAADPISRLAENPAAALALGVTLILHDWSDLTLAVREGLGGHESEEKRDWLCSHIADMAALPEPALQPPTGTTASTPSTADDDADMVDDITDTLEGALADEFATSVEDEKAVFEIAQRVVLLRRKLINADRAILTDVYNRYKVWQERKKEPVRVQISDSDSDDDDGSDESSDENDGAGNSSNGKSEKTGPVVDQDGFTLVQGRRR